MRDFANKIYVVLLSCLILFAATSCRHSSPAGSLLASADAVMHTYPDSALRLLKQVSHPEKLSGEQQALYALLFTQASYKNGITVESDSLISIACYYYSASPDSIRKAWSCFYAAQVYRDMSMPQKALEYFHMADNASRGMNDYRLFSLINYHWGNLLGKQKMYDDNIKLLNNSLESNINRQDTSGILFCLSQLGWTYILKDKIDSAEIILKKGIDLLENYRPCKQAVRLYQQMAIVCNMQKNHKDALLFINKGIKANGEDRPQLSITKGNIFLDMQQYDSAAYYYSKDTRYEQDWEKRGRHLIWAKFYEKKGDYREASENWKMASLLADTIAINEHTEEIARIQKRYDYTVIKHENDRLKLQQLQSRFWMVVLCGSLLVAVAAIYIIYLTYKRYRKKKEEVISTKDKLMQQLRIQLQDRNMELQQEKEKVLMQELEHSRRMNDYDTELKKRDDRIQRMAPSEEKMRNYILGQSAIVQKMKHLQDMCMKDQLASVLGKNEQEEVLFTADLCFNNFVSRLRELCPSLSDSDLLLCSLIRLGMSAADIVCLLDIQKQTFKKRKSRIKCEKLCLAEEVSLDDFLASF